MESLLSDIIALLQQAGPGIVFVITAAETAFFIGLLLPAEATVLVAAFMADLGYFRLGDVLLATLLGGFAGDQVGYLLGRFGGRRAVASEGRIGRLWRQQEPRATALFKRRAIYSVSLARFISFVRTLMPWFAGMSGMPYRQFLIYDIIGVTGWGVASVMAGYLAGRSWEVLATALGTFSSVVVIALIVAAIVAVARNRRGAKEVRRVALTGNIASGKSVVADVWRQLGAHVIDADALARRAVEPGTDVLRRISERFGAGVLAGDELDRAALRQVAFANDENRRGLESILHPEIERLRREAEDAAVAAGAQVVVHEIPLLFETGLDREFPTVIVVDAPPAVRRARLMEKRGLTPAEAEAMMSAQLPAEEKRERATAVIDNDGTLAELEERARAAYAEFVEVQE